MIFHKLGLILNREVRRGVAPSKTPHPPLLKKERGTQGVRLFHKNQLGFTLVELMLAIAVAGVITGGITMTLFQVFDANARTSNHMTAVRQVQEAGYWVSHDAQMAQIVDTPGASGFPLTLTWTDWDSNDVYTVIYDLVDSKLRREHYTNKDGSPPDATAFLAQHIDPTGTTCKFTHGHGVLTFTVTATVGSGSQEQSETRVYEIVPRPGS